MLFHGSVYLQLTVPFTCTDMRFILFINNLSTLLLIIYVDILYKSLLLMKCVIFFFFFLSKCSFFFTCNVSYDRSLSLRQIHRWTTRKEENVKIITSLFTPGIKIRC